MVKNVDRLFPKAQGDLLLTQRYREAEISIWAFYLKKITQNVKKFIIQQQINYSTNCCSSIVYFCTCTNRLMR